ncbi:LysM peptidoglycan-binding domain-containing protein [Desulfobacterales bacterium HSG16]|nr:LysM peptidoglycan-binding domain-containing protein [Desulfobacterales bacterium HSG16]
MQKILQSAIIVLLCLSLGMNIVLFNRLIEMEREFSGQKTYLKNSIDRINDRMEEFFLHRQNLLSAVPETKDTYNLTEDNNLPSQMYKSLDPPEIKEKFQEEIPKEVYTAKNHKNQKPDDDPAFHIYETRDTDTLWDIAKFFYESGKYYPVILEHNPDLQIYRIGYGIKIKLLKNNTIASEIYNRIVVKKHGSLYWNYTAKEGDTFESIASRISRSKDILKIIPEFSPGTNPVPGQKIPVYLY